MSKRFEDALFIQQGACNPSGIAHTLVKACKECLDAGVSQREDPAVRLIVHQLAYLCNVGDVMDTFAYNKMVKACEDKMALNAAVLAQVLDHQISTDYKIPAADTVKRTLEHVANMNSDDELPDHGDWAIPRSKDQEFKGFHKFTADNGEECGTFEVHYVDHEVPTADEPFKVGWYWRSCNGVDNTPDGDDHGPFPEAEGAYLDAVEGGEFHG